jgi:hypothetical protein
MGLRRRDTSCVEGSPERSPILDLLRERAVCAPAGLFCEPVQLIRNAD